MTIRPMDTSLPDPIAPPAVALAHFRVLDLTRVRSGPTAVRQLADWGADVIKIEMPEALAGAEAMGGPRNGPDFQNLHRNKRSLTLDLKSPDGIQVLRRLVATADVLVENFRPDVKARLGIDYETLSRDNPRLVYASISGFGQDGPYAERAGFDQIAQGMGGLMSITGRPGDGPMRVGIPIADLTAGLFCALGILTALHERTRSGRGQWVQTSLLQAQVAMLDFQATRWLMDGEVPKQAGNNHPTTIPTGVFATADGHVNIAVTGQKIWEKFCRALDAADWIADPDYATGRARSQNRDQLTAAIEQRLAGRGSAEWMERLNAAGVPCGPIHRIDEVFADPQVRHLGIAQAVESPAHGRPITLVGQPVRLSRTDSRIASAAPAAGADTAAILAEIGYGEAEIADLTRRQVV
ncbi:CoA transferase [Allostella vacuolata]|nr:CoA transferase [Stella vacuolata]